MTGSGVKQQPKLAAIQAARALERWLLTARCQLLPCRRRGVRARTGAPAARRPEAAAWSGQDRAVRCLGLRDWGSAGGARPRFRGRSLLSESDRAPRAERRDPLVRRLVRGASGHRGARAERSGRARSAAAAVLTRRPAWTPTCPAPDRPPTHPWRGFVHGSRHRCAYSRGLRHELRGHLPPPSPAHSTGTETLSHRSGHAGRIAG